MKIRKIICVALAALFCSATLVSGVLTSKAANCFPTTAIEYHNLSSYLFSQVTLSTGDNMFGTNDNWKYYYWCDFTPQYSADYTVTITTFKMMKTELYDSEENLLSSSFSPENKNENNKYVFSNTFFLEKGKTYYYKFAFTGGYFNSCGNFTVNFESDGSPELQSDDHIHLYINNKNFGQKYELSDYTDDKLLNDLSLKVVYPDGTLKVWERSKTVFPYLDGCDIILDLSDCKTEVGVHKVTAHYKGYTSTASFEIVDCIHEYQQMPADMNWLEPGKIVFKCTKCGISYSSSEAPPALELCKNFSDHINSVKGDDNFDTLYDADFNGVINIRDYTLLRSVYYSEIQSFIYSMNSSEGEGNFNEKLDYDNNGLINIRDFSILVQSLNEL